MWLGIFVEVDCWKRISFSGDFSRPEWTYWLQNRVLNLSVESMETICSCLNQVWAMVMRISCSSSMLLNWSSAFDEGSESTCSSRKALITKLFWEMGGHNLERCLCETSWTLWWLTNILYDLYDRETFRGVQWLWAFFPRIQEVRLIL